MTTFDATLGPWVQQAPINFSSSGDNIVVPGVVGKKTKILQFFFVVAAATNLTFKSEATALTGLMEYSTNAAEVQDFIQLPLTCLVAGDDFIINSSIAVQVGGTVWYIQS